MRSDWLPSQDDIASALDPQTLHLMIFPTEDCNFRCTYCFEDHVPGRMKPELVEGIKKLIDRRVEDLYLLRLAWFGGEPLMAKNIVFDICEFAYRRCQEKEVIYAGEMTTNGYFLTPAVMERLSAAGQRHFHVSLDGIGEAHNRTRPLSSGKGTFDRIWNNLTALRDSPYEFDVEMRVHYGMPAADETEALCRRLNAHFGGDPRFRIILQRIADLGGENSGKFEPIPLSEGLRLSRKLVEVMPDIVVADPDTAEDGICYAARPNSLLIRTDGRISKCAVNLKDPRNTVGHIDDDGRLHIDAQYLQRWMQGFGDMNAEKLSCPYTGISNDPYPKVVPTESFSIPVVAEPSRKMTGGP